MRTAPNALAAAAWWLRRQSWAGRGWLPRRFRSSPAWRRASGRSAGAPVEADLSKLSPGQLATVEWRGKPVWILHRTPEMIERLGRFDRLLLDPASARTQQPKYCGNPLRSIRPEWWIAVALCTHLGCVPSVRKDVAPADLGPDWPGGFYCPCHGSKFDFAGRVFRNVPAPLNLEVPRHRFLSDAVALIGADEAGQG